MNTLVLRCPDGRNTLSLMFGHQDLGDLGILEAPQIGAVSPRDVVHIILQNNVRRVLVINHTTLPFLEGCAGLASFNNLNGLGGRLATWLTLNIATADPLIQVKSTGTMLGQSIPAEIEITVFLFDHLLQSLFPVGTKFPHKKWHWVGYRDRKGYNYYPVLHSQHLTDPTRKIVEINQAYSPYARNIAKASGFLQSQSFHNLVLNSTVYPPETVLPILGDREADPYFSVYVSKLFPADAITQMEYAMKHVTHPTNLWILAQEMAVINHLRLRIEDTESFQKNKCNISVRAAIVSENPY